MQIIITAGGTREKIDTVRKITNTATGKLGCLTAEALVKQGGGRIDKIFYICAQGSFVPDIPCITVVSTEGVDQVKNALSHLLTTHKIDAVIHAMAVSDYTVESLTTAEHLAAFIAKKLFPFKPHDFEGESALAAYITGCIKENDRLLDQTRKIGSDIENLMLFMKQTPKLIGLIKSLQPSTVLVGFKLLNNVQKQQLLDAGYDLLVKNSCDLVLANDQSQITEERHSGFLLSPDKIFTRLETKAEIAEEIARRVLNLIDKKV